MNNKAIEQIIIDCFTPLYEREVGINAKSFMLKTKHHKVSDEKIYAAINTYAHEVKKEDIVMYIDSTLFGGGDEGIIMTTEKLYYNNSDKRGVINLFDISFCMIEKSFWGTSTQIKAAGVYHELGQIVALKEPNRKLEQGMDNLIEALKNFDNLDSNLIECFKKLFDQLEKNNKSSQIYLKGYSSQDLPDNVLLLIQTDQGDLSVQNKKIYLDGSEFCELKNLKRAYLDEDEGQLSLYSDNNEKAVTLSAFDEDEQELVQDAFDEVIILLKNEKV